MRILIATGIFKPELGGPATAAFELAKRLSASGHEVEVLTYSDKPSFPFDEKQSYPIRRVVRAGKFSNYWRYFRAARVACRGKDIVYTLDWFSAGVPVMIAAKLERKRYVVRVGGGYIWEKYLAEGGAPMPLKEFYAQGLHKRYRVMFGMIRAVLRNAAAVIFNSSDQRELYAGVYGLSRGRTVVIENAVPDNKIGSLVQDYNARSFDRDKEVVFAGRLIKMKNVETLLAAFSMMKDGSYRLLVIGDGPLEGELKAKAAELGIAERTEFHPAMSQSELYYRIARSHLVVIPSWTDVSPNQAYECLGLGIPFLISRENYLPIRSQLPLVFDPASPQELATALDRLSERQEYEAYATALRKVKYRHSWDQAVDEHLRVFAKIIKQNA